MKRFIVCLTAVLLALPVLAGAETLVLPAGLELTFTVPEGWEYSRQAPDFLVAETVAHATHEMAEQGKEVDEGRLHEMVSRRLAANEAFVYQPDSHSILLIDFSPLREGEEAPSRGAVERSARYAAEGLHEEEGASNVRADSEKTDFTGLPIVYRIDASYAMHGEPRRFVGIVGFRAPYWIYLYYTDTLRNGDDLPAMEEMLAGASLAEAEGS